MASEEMRHYSSRHTALNCPLALLHILRFELPRIGRRDAVSLCSFVDSHGMEICVAISESEAGGMNKNRGANTISEVCFDL